MKFRVEYYRTIFEKRYILVRAKNLAQAVEKAKPKLEDPDFWMLSDGPYSKTEITEVKKVE